VEFKMPTVKWFITRDDEEIEIEAEYEVEPLDPGCSYGPPEFCEPPSGGEISSLEVWNGDGSSIELTSEEEAALEAHIYETHDYSE
jgi:hypothetical protein